MSRHLHNVTNRLRRTWHLPEHARPDYSPPTPLVEALVSAVLLTVLAAICVGLVVVPIVR